MKSQVQMLSWMRLGFGMQNVSESFVRGFSSGENTVFLFVGWRAVPGTWWICYLVWRRCRDFCENVDATDVKVPLLGFIHQWNDGGRGGGR